MADYTRERLIQCLKAEHRWLCEEEGIEEGDLTPEQFAAYVEKLTYEQLVNETTTDDTYLTLDEFVEHWSDE